MGFNNMFNMFGWGAKNVPALERSGVEMAGQSPGDTRMLALPSANSAVISFNGHSYQPEEILGLDTHTLKIKCLNMYWRSIHAKGAISQINALTVNSGLRLQSQPNRQILGISPEAASGHSEQIESIFDVLRRQMTFSYDGTSTEPQLEALGMFSLLGLGEIFAILRYNNSKNALNRVTVQLVDPLSVKSPPSNKNTLSANTEIIDGIELKSGKPVAFHIEIINEKGEISYKRIPLTGSKSGKRIGIHYFEKEQVDQVRGVGILAPMFSSLERMQQAIRLEMDSMAANATVAAAIVRDKTTIDTDKLLREFAGETASDAVEKPQDSIKTQRVATQHGGIVLQSFEGGERLESFDTKRPNINIPAFIEKEIEWIGPAIGISSSVWRMLFSSNYSASKGELELSWRNFEKRIAFFAAGFTQPILEAVIDMEIAAGDMSLPGWSDARKRAAYMVTKWQGIPIPSLNPLQEAKASTERINNVTSNGDTESQKYTGLSFDTNADRREQEQIRLGETRQKLIDLGYIKEEVDDIIAEELGDGGAEESNIEEESQK